MAAKNPQERQLVARLAAHSKWAKTPDRSGATAPARQAFLGQFGNENALRAHMTRMALRSAQARRKAT